MQRISFDRIGPLLKSKWILILSGIGLGFALLCLAFAARILLEPAKIQIQSRIESALPGHRARIGGLSTNYFNSISAAPVEISNNGGFDNGALLKIEKVRIRYSLLDVLKMKWHPEKSIGVVEILNPTVKLARRNSLWTRPNFKKGGGKMIPLKIQVRDGRIAFEDDLGKLDVVEILNITASIDTQQRSPSFEAAAETREGEKVRLKGSLEAPSFSAELEAVQFRPGGWLDRFLLLPSTVSVQGALDAKASIQGSWPHVPAEGKPFALSFLSACRFSGEAELHQLTASVPVKGTPRAFSAEGKIKFGNDKVETGSLILKTGDSRIQISGGVASPFDSRLIQAQAFGNVKVKDLLQSLGAESAQEGDIQLQLAGSGTAQNPELNGTVKVREGTLLKVPLSLESEVHFSSRVLTLKSLEGLWGDGRVSARGSFSREKVLWDASLSAFPVAQLFPAAKASGGKIEGKATVRISGSGDFQNPKARGRIRVSGFSWGGSAPLSLSGRMDHDRNVFKAGLSSQDPAGRFTLEVRRKDGAAQIRECRVVLPGGDSVRVSGRIDASRKISGRIEANSFSVANLAPLVKNLSRFQGRLSLKGALSGTMADPVLKGKAAGSALSLKQASEGLGGFRSDILWEKNLFQLTNLAIGV